MLRKQPSSMISYSSFEGVLSDTVTAKICLKTCFVESLLLPEKKKIWKHLDVT